MRAEANEVVAQQKAVDRKRYNDPVEIEARKSEQCHLNLEEYDYLVSEHYVDPRISTLYEVIILFCDK